MDEAEIKKIIAKAESELTGDAEHDADIWLQLGEQYRDEPGSGQLIAEIGHRLLDLVMDEDREMAEEIFADMVADAGDDYVKACDLIDQNRYEEALHKLLVLTALIRAYRLPEEYVWMDFSSYLDSLLYQDYFSEEIGDREIRRHPMHPAKMLYTCGSLLIEMGRAEEALEPLLMLLDFDPVCPKYLFEYGEACKRTGRLEEAYSAAVRALYSASNRAELARAYRDIGYCMTETGLYEDAVMLYLLSLSFQSSPHAEAEIAWIRKKFGIASEAYSREALLQRCDELGIPVGINETVQQNIDFLNDLMDPASD